MNFSFQIPSLHISPLHIPVNNNLYIIYFILITTLPSRTLWIASEANLILLETHFFNCLLHPPTSCLYSHISWLMGFTQNHQTSHKSVHRLRLECSQGKLGAFFENEYLDISTSHTFSTNKIRKQGVEPFSAASTRSRRRLLIADGFGLLMKTYI